MRFIISLLLVTACGVARAKDLSHRLGVGFADQYDLPSLALRYYPNADYGLMLALGLNTVESDSRFALAGKVMRVVFREDNLNFYVAAQAALLSGGTDSGTRTGFDVSGLFGAEFFLPGLENLGVNFEAGFGVTSIASEVRARTVGDHPLRAGLFFYF